MPSDKLKVIIAEDNRLSRKAVIQDIPWKKLGMEICGEASNGEEALQAIRDNQPDIALMDIKMPVLTGLDVIEKLSDLDPKPLYIILTAYDDYELMRRGIQDKVFDYILKPYTKERIRKTISRVKQNMEEQESNKQIGEIINSKNNFVLAIENKFIVLNPEKEIVLIKTLQGKLQFYTTRGILESKLLLKDVESRLNRSGFLRTNKSFLVNINMVKEIEPWFNDTYLLIMNHYEKEEVPVSRHYLKDFKTVMGIL